MFDADLIYRLGQQGVAANDVREMELWEAMSMLGWHRHPDHWDKLHAEAKARAKEEWDAEHGSSGGETAGVRSRPNPRALLDAAADNHARRRAEAVRATKAPQDTNREGAEPTNVAGSAPNDSPFGRVITDPAELAKFFGNKQG